MKEVLHETGTHATGLSFISKSFGSLRKAKPATKLVFMEDLVATSGGLIAIIAILISHFTPFHAAEGIASIMIGIMMLFVVGRVFLDNAAGALGEADEEMEGIIAEIIVNDSDVKDIQSIVVIKEGEELHVDVEIELNSTLTVAEANDIKERLENKIMGQKGVADVTIEVHEDDGVSSWK
jgi:divalent metal cation (Fe/Co/Zn/Cd) transporter